MASELGQVRSAILRISSDVMAGRLVGMPGDAFWSKYPLIGEMQRQDIFTRGSNLAEANMLLIGMSMNESLYDRVSSITGPISTLDAPLQPSMMTKVEFDVEIEREGADPQIRQVKLIVPMYSTPGDWQQQIQEEYDKLRRTWREAAISRVSEYRLLYGS